MLLVALAAVIIGVALFAYMKISASRSGQSLELTPEAKQYLSSLKLSDVEMKATESYLKQRIVEITGKIGDNGNRGIDYIEIYCVFSRRLRAGGSATACRHRSRECGRNQAR